MPDTTPSLATQICEEDTLRSYYDGIAVDYDSSRFNNSYGRYLESQERRILQRWLPAGDQAQVLDLACGSGRFLDFASLGLDASAKMLQVAQHKAAGRPLVQASATAMPLAANSFDAVFALHLLMHLKPATVAEVLDECHRVLRPGGVVIFDVPSAVRRRLLRFRPQGWHGATALSLAGIERLTAPKWQLAASSAVLMLPVHRIPSAFRSRLTGLDNLLCSTWLQPLASYLFVQLRKPVAA
jgi:SAM-dependent methyltransferase